MIWTKRFVQSENACLLLVFTHNFWYTQSKICKSLKDLVNTLWGIHTKFENFIFPLGILTSKMLQRNFKYFWRFLIKLFIFAHIFLKIISKQETCFYRPRGSLPTHI